MEECCKFVPIIVNGKYIGGNIVYCSKHAAAPDMYEALEWAYRVHGDHGGFAAGMNVGLRHALEWAYRVYGDRDRPLGLGAAMAAALAKARGEAV